MCVKCLNINSCWIFTFSLRNWGYVLIAHRQYSFPHLSHSKCCVNSHLGMLVNLICVRNNFDTTDTLSHSTITPAILLSVLATISHALWCKLPTFICSSPIILQRPPLSEGDTVGDFEIFLRKDFSWFVFKLAILSVYSAASELYI